jgi:large subunit ribosomal protein L9
LKMKVILNKDLAPLGEEGDVKDVAKGYARNYLFPRGIALPYTPQTVKLFESRKGQIEERKSQKRQDAMGLKERLESLELSITMSAGANGRLYGAVTSQTVSDELAKLGFQIERKRIDLSSAGIKSAGKYKAAVRLYENSQAEISITIIGRELKTEAKQAQSPKPRTSSKEQEKSDEALPEMALETAKETGLEEANLEALEVQESGEASSVDDAADVDADAENAEIKD